MGLYKKHETCFILSMLWSHLTYFDVHKQKSSCFHTSLLHLNNIGLQIRQLREQNRKTISHLQVFRCEI